MSLAKINNLLLLAIVLINAYIIGAPFIPFISSHLQNQTAVRQQLTSQIHQPTTSGSPVVAPAASQPNQVIIPSMLLDNSILEGPVSQTYKILDKGIWRWPHGSTPDKGGNTILIGHRFTYTQPKGVFYYLNKVAVGDEIGLIWNNVHYLYKVTATTVVSPSDTAIENQTTTPELTLFTCTPLWLPKDRLVVVANLESHS